METHSKYVPFQVGVAEFVVAVGDFVVDVVEKRVAFVVCWGVVA